MNYGLDKTMDRKDIFDILGISTREDSFTNLIAEAFNNVKHEEFRNAVCNFLSHDEFCIINEEDCNIRTRCVFNIEKGKSTGDRSKILPDMLLISKSQNKVVILESKIFSEEGYKQTAAYSSEIFLVELDAMLIREYNMQGTIEKEFYYLTLMGDSPCSERFKTLKWTDLIINTTEGKKFDSPFDLLMKDLLERAMELRTFVETPVSGTETFNDYYKLQGKWIDNRIIVKKYFGTILNGLGKKYGESLSYSINKSEGRIPQILVTLMSPNWVRYNLDEYIKDTPIGEFQYTRNIHIEFTWQVGAENASIMIHYETYPYYSQEKLKEMFPLIEPVYKKYRNEFKTKITSLINDSQYWKVANTRLALAKITYKNFIGASYMEFSEWFTKVIDEAFVIINSCLASE